MTKLVILIGDIYMIFFLCFIALLIGMCIGAIAGWSRLDEKDFEELERKYSPGVRKTVQDMIKNKRWEWK